MWVFAGNVFAGTGRFFLPGTDREIFSGHDVSSSICDHSSRAANSESKLRPINVEWSDERHMVWKEGPDTLYADKLSILSDQRQKEEPRSARTRRIPLDVRDLASPVSSSTTGTPVACKFHLPSPPLLVYKFTMEPQTKT